jgi:hypothetical protein
MNRLIIALFLLSSGVLRSQEYGPDSLSLESIDTVVLKSESNPSFGEKIGKFLGIDDKEQEIKNLKETVGYQQEMIEQLSSLVTEPTVVIKNVPNLDAASAASLKKDAEFLEDLPSSYGDLPKSDLAKITREIDDKIAELTKQRDSLIRSKGSKELISAKNNIISSLEREKNVIRLSGETADLQDKNGVLNEENDELKVKENELRKYLYTSLIVLAILVLVISVILQRKAIKRKDGTIEEQFANINKKNTYLEYAARLIRHDMHSGINTYMPRGISGLEKRISQEEMESAKLGTSFKMLKEGLAHTQRVYKSVYEFTNIVKKNVVLERKRVNLTELINNFILTTSYSSQVELGELIEADVNPTLFCNAIDNLIKNGLKYNDSSEKRVKVYMQEDELIIQDNGRGLSQKEFERIGSAHTAGEETGLGINISSAILKEHGFDISCEKIEKGTKIKIRIKQ